MRGRNQIGCIVSAHIKKEGREYRGHCKRMVSNPDRGSEEEKKRDQ